ncbi:acyl-CoA dehydrogenase family protein [Actinoalloteichus caeruleus]|uniref:acyl-CoA dehydrogenase family protein n=1 Tax=Actinoalloteichus cyanogriseus TaxID=2893586 RepID=UPI003BB8CD52|nr:CgpN [Actinoalloteichus caeruleus]
MDPDNVLEQVLTGAPDRDRLGTFPREAVDALARCGAFGVAVPAVHGGDDGSARDLGALAERLGRGCTGARGLLTVQEMVLAALLRWGTAEQRDHWIPRLVSGELVAGFAATEPEAGTELGAVSTTVERDGDELVISGRKVWVTFGSSADVLLVLGTTAAGPVTVLVEADRAGLERVPIRDPLGMRSARLADLVLDSVRVPVANQVAPAGFGLSHVVATALDHGRFTVAWGCVGMADACLRAAVERVAGRDQGGVLLRENPVVRAMLGRAAVAVASARALCERATTSRDERTPEALVATVTAKYAAARAAATASGTAVQLLGAAGCAGDSVAGRFFRDAKIMQIIEGADEVSEVRIGDHLLRSSARPDGGGAL